MGRELTNKHPAEWMLNSGYGYISWKLWLEKEVKRIPNTKIKEDKHGLFLVRKRGR